MKLTTILLIVFGLHLSARTHSQDVTISVKNAPFEKVLGIIKDQTGFTFFADGDLLSSAKPVSVSIKQVSVKEALDIVFKGQPFVYSLDGKIITIESPAPTTITDGLNHQLLSPSLPPPPITVRGRIVNEKGEPVVASITVKGALLGTVSDLYGNFVLENVEENSILIISGINIESQEVRVGQRTNINITAVRKVDAEEEIVFKGYYSTTNKLNTGSVGKVTAEAIEKQPINNPLQAMQGRIPGVFIEQQTGIPGSNFKVRIRGKNSLQSGLDPLYVIDGVPFSLQNISLFGPGSVVYGVGENGGLSPLYNINPGDIEKIEVLKDADATAIFGSRGANGVILITTKKGKQGKIAININASTGISQVARFAKLLNTSQYIAMREQAHKNDNAPLESWEVDIDGTFDKNRYTDWQKVLLGGNGQMTMGQMSFSGGNNTAQYLFSANYQKETLVYPGSAKSEKGSFLFSINNHAAQEKLKINFSTSYVMSKGNLPGQNLTGAALSLPPNSPALFDENGKINWQNGSFNNPLSYLEARYNQTTNNLISNATLSYEIFKGLQIKSSFGLNRITTDEKQNIPSTYYNPAWGLGPESAMSRLSNNNTTSWIIEPQISWEPSNAGIGKLSVILGSTYQSQTSDAIVLSLMGFPSDNFIDDPQAAVNDEISFSNKFVYKYLGWFGRVGYNINDKYIFNMTGRRDGSSRFGPGKQFANFGAVGASWILSEEKFFQDVFRSINLAKIRGSYGLTGNDKIGDYQYLNTYDSYNPYQGYSGIAPTALFNPNFAWETTRKGEIALELSFFNSRLSFTGAYYNNRSSNQLINYRMPRTTGFPSMLRNFPAKIENSGAEFELTSVNASGKLKWTTSLNITIPRNKLLKFDNLEGSSYANDYAIGKSLDLIKRYKFIGVNTNTGIYEFEDINNDGLLTLDDRIVIVERKQPYYAGIQNTFTFANLEIQFLLQVVNKQGIDLPFMGGVVPGGFGNQYLSTADGVWQKAGDVANIQRYVFSDPDAMRAYSNVTLSDKFQTNVSFVRLKNVSVAYSLSEKIIPHVKATIFAQAQNLFTITNYTGLDPETSAGYPLLRTIVAGFKFNF